MSVSASAQFLLVTIGSAGDVFPYIEIGKELQSRGHRVTLMTTPLLEDMVRGRGLDFAPFGDLDQLKSAANDPAIHGEATGPASFWSRLIAPNLTRIAQYVTEMPSDGPVFVLAHTFLVPVAALAQGKRDDVTLINPILQPMFIRSDYTRQTLGVPKLGHITFGRWMPAIMRRKLMDAGEDKMLNAPILPSLNKARTDLNLPPVGSFFKHIQTAADLYVPLFPEWYTKPARDWPQPMVQTDFVFYDTPDDQQISSELEAFLDGGAPPVVFTAGTGNFQAKRLYNTVIPVLSDLNLRAVFLTHVRHQLPDDLPDSMIWQAYAPFDKLLPRARVLVQHGGIGTTAEALRAGVPQLVTPFGYDQYDNARRIKEMGAGLSLPVQHLTAIKFAKAMQKLVSGKYPQSKDLGSGTTQGTDRIVSDLLNALS
ncbi:MAG: nucleotide disphospho-sugar-binding domain-containing protein [Pseudoruegeria sp.]